jgi:hypothetical protein
VFTVHNDGTADLNVSGTSLGGADAGEFMIDSGHAPFSLAPDGWWASGDDTWVPWVINRIYGTSFQTDPANIGKCMAWTDWTHAP